MIMCIHYIVQTSQSEVTVMQSDDNQSRKDDENCQVECTNGLYISVATGSPSLTWMTH